MPNTKISAAVAPAAGAGSLAHPGTELVDFEVQKQGLSLGPISAEYGIIPQPWLALEWTNFRVGSCTGSLSWIEVTIAGSG